MRSALKTEIRNISVFVTAVSLLGGLFGQFWLFLAVALLASLFRAFLHTWRLAVWIEGGLKDELPQLAYLWFVMARALRRRKLRQEDATRGLRRAVKKISSLTHAIDDGILVLKQDYRLDWWNLAARKQLNLRPGDRGQPLTSLVRNSAFAAYLHAGNYESGITLPARIQSGRWLMYSASVFNKSGDIAIVISDVTLLKNTEQLRKEFVANVSHELRTPITVLRGYLETLSDEVLLDLPALQKACAQMSGQVMRMQALADDLLVLSRLESKPELMETERLELKPLLQTALHEAELLSAGRHTFSFSCPVDAFLLAEASDLHSVFSNLLINAVSHNPEGAHIEVLVERNTPAELSVLVRDNGIGIPAEAIPRLTERFYRTDQSRNSNIGGSGLGLAIVKHIVNRYGGELEISSRLGQGSSFRCHFPLTKAEAEKS